VKNNPAANLQLFLVAVARKDAAAAAGHLATLKGHLEEPVLEKLLEGRLRLLERKPAEALGVFMEAARMDPRRADALLMAGVAAAQDGRRDEAFRVLAQVLQADPLRLAPRPAITSFYLRPGDLLAGLEGSIVGIARDDDDLLPHLYEGLLRFHQGDAAAAEKMLKKVAEVDSNNAPSFAYRTLIAMGRKDMNAAKAHAARAVAGGRQVAIAHLVQGLVLAESKQPEPAKRSLREAVTLAPKLYAAEVKLAELEASTSRDAVRARLVRLLGLDPSYQPAKRVLYLLDKRG
jgi:tetratricopeptide (TPR) repeat protein